LPPDTLDDDSAAALMENAGGIQLGRTNPRNKRDNDNDDGAGNNEGGLMMAQLPIPPPLSYNKLASASTDSNSPHYSSQPSSVASAASATGTAPKRNNKVLKEPKSMKSSG
jgi:hypothetical protein